MKHSHLHRIVSVILLSALLCCSNTIGQSTHLPQITLTDYDRASIIGSVARNLFRPGSTYEGKHFILADGVRPEWIPKVAGYDVAVVTRKEIESSSTPLYYYAFRLRPLRRSVHVTVDLYDSETGTFPHVILHYSYRRAGRKWHGKYLWGAGD